MFNILKSGLRNLKNNKIITIGVTFIIFLAIFVFTLLSSTVNNIKTTYNNIVKEGNLHDFTINEKYNFSSPTWDFYAGGISSISGNYVGTSSDGHNIPWPTEQTTGSGTYQRTYMLCLSFNNPSTNDLLYEFYQEQINNPSSIYLNILFPILTTTSTTQLGYINNTSATKVSNETATTAYSQLNNIGDLSSLQQQLSYYSQQIISLIQENHVVTPMQNYLNTNNYKFREFSSLDIPNSRDGKYYKVVESNPTDSIDKMKLFDNSDWNNFSNDDFDLGGIISKYGNITKILQYVLPSYSSTEDEKARDYFKLLNLGEYGDNTSLKQQINILANSNWTDTNFISAYNSLFAYDSTKTIYNKGYRVTIQWTNGPVPVTIWFVNWTTDFAVCTSEYMKTNNKCTLPEKTYINEDSFSSFKENWQNLSPNEKQIRFKQWMNSLSNIDFETWLTKIIYSNQEKTEFNDWIIAVDGGTPYIIIGTGTTPDFIYPSVSIQNVIINPNKECVFFTNSMGFERINDSFRTNPSEHYLVGKFAFSSNKQQQLDKINSYAKSVMSYPTNIKCAYMYNDTNNFLNSSAFRLIFIPNMIKSISYINISLTTFIIIICILVILVVVSNYINMNIGIFGILKANGYKRRRIALFIAPFIFLSVLVGAVCGYLFGLFLQIPTLKLFNIFWTIPTKTIAFEWTSCFITFFIPFVVIFLCAFLFVIWKIRKNSCEIVKVNNVSKENIVSNFAKKSFSKTNIIIRFRSSLAFQSLFKLLILTIITSLSISLIFFSFVTKNSFKTSMNKSYDNKKYSYAINLETPTTQSGQYNPTSSDYFGDSGIIKVGKEQGFIPGSYFGTNHDMSPYNPYDHSTGYEIFNNDAINGLYNKYYHNTFDLYDIFAIGSPDIREQLWNNQCYNQNLLLPMMNDSTGQLYDLQYLKNKFLQKNLMDYTVGLSGNKTNPWNITASLIPENEENLINNENEFITKCIGWKLHPEAISHVVDKNDWNRVNGKYTTDNSYTTNLVSPYENNNSWMDSNGKPLYENYNSHVSRDSFLNPPEYLDINGNVINDPKNNIDKICDVNWTFNKNSCTDIIGLDPSFVKLLQATNYDLLLPDNSRITSSSIPSIKVSDYNYSIRYSTVPLSNTDETYTYLNIVSNNKKGYKKTNVSDNTVIYGIKDDTTFVKLVNKKTNLLPTLFDNVSVNDSVFPIVIGKYTAEKYGLHVGDKISFAITNTVDRYSEKIKNYEDPNYHEKQTTADFKISGICDMYEGESFYISQDVANLILGLKSHLDDNTGNYVEPKSLYINKQQEVSGVDIADPSVDWGYKNEWGNTDPINPPSTDVDPTSSLIDLTNKNNYANQNNTNYTSYGFNGIFTNDKNGSTFLKNGISLYSLSGIYPANDKISDQTMSKLYKYGSNMQIISQLLGLWKGIDNVDNTTLGNKIYHAWLQYISSSENVRKTMQWWIYNGEDLYNELLTEVVSVFGTTSVITLINSADDCLTSKLVYETFSSVIKHIENIIIVVVEIIMLFIIFTMSIIIINDNRKYAGILKSIGYTNKENILSFTSIYLSTVTIASILSIPFSLFVCKMYKISIFNALKLLLVINYQWYFFVYAILFIFVLFGIGILYGWKMLRKIDLTNIIKNTN